MKLFRILVFPALLTFNYAQLQGQGKELTIEDCFNPANYPQSLRAVQWIPNSHKFSHVKGNMLVSTDPYSNRTDTVVTLKQLTAAVASTGGTLSYFPAIHWKDESTIWFTTENAMYTYTLSSGFAVQKRRFGDNPQTIEVANSSLNVATVEKENLFVHTANGTRKLTENGGNGIVYGQSVHQNEFGITKGLFWNEEGTKLAFYRMDERVVPEYPLMHIDQRPAYVTKFRYPMAGDSSHTVKIGVYNTFTEEITYLETDGPYDQYLTNVTWSPDGVYIYVAIVNREQNTMQLKRFNSFNGKLDKVLFEEKHEKYVEPEHGPIFLPGNSSDFIWFSERDGYDHLYLYQTGKSPRQITSGNWEVTQFLGFDKSGETIYVETTRESPLERHAYSIRLKDREYKLKKLTSSKGTHAVTVNNYSGLFLDVHTSRKVPKTYSVYKMDGTMVNEVFTSPNPLQDFKLGEIKVEPYLVNGIALYTRTFLPPDFDPKEQKKYPVIVYVYGGPHAQMITETWLAGANLWFHYMAQNGYIVFTVDNRGSAHKGLQFENATHRQLGTVEMADQIGALNYLKSFPYIDSNRIGVHGWSFGGFMTTSLMTRENRNFKVGVAGGPVIDWKYYEIMYTERYMDKPQENPEGYKNASLLNYLPDLKGRLLMIHGVDDNVVVWQHSLLYVQEAIKKWNVNLDYFVYPGHAHNVYGADRTHLYKKISQYFFDFL